MRFNRWLAEDILDTLYFLGIYLSDLQNLNVNNPNCENSGNEGSIPVIKILEDFCQKLLIGYNMRIYQLLRDKADTKEL